MLTKKAYFIGIKGVGMAALAIYLKQSGYEVTGSDVAEKFVTDKLLKENGITYFEGFDIKNLKGQKYDLIVSSAVYGSENPEVEEAKKRKLYLKYYSEVLGEISRDKKTIAVAGVHGKTTISAMLALIIDRAGLKPSFIVGAGELPNFKTNAQKGEGEYFVLEADEYRKSPEDNSSKFLDLTPQIAIISSIELDHPDIFPTIEEMYRAFYSLACRVPRNGSVVLCIDYPRAKKLQQSLADRNFETYGFDPTARWRILNINQNIDGISFAIESLGQIYGPFEMQLAGNHNILNATAAIVTALCIGISENIIKKALADFKTVKRRFEKIGQKGDIVVIDDYAHHPTAIISTIEAAKRRYVNYKIWCIFQPHTYSRTEKLFEDFGRSFKSADYVVITDIYSSAREEKGKITGNDLAEEIKEHQKRVRFIPNFSDISNYIVKNIKGPAVILTLGAGNIYEVGIEINKNLSREK